MRLTYEHFFSPPWELDFRLLKPSDIETKSIYVDCNLHVIYLEECLRAGLKLIFIFYESRFSVSNCVFCDNRALDSGSCLTEPLKMAPVLLSVLCASQNCDPIGWTTKHPC